MVKSAEITLNDITPKEQKIKDAINNYNILNEINLPDNVKKFPYNFLNMTITPTYKEFNIEYIKGREYFEKPKDKSKSKSPKRGGEDDPRIIIIFG